MEWVTNPVIVWLAILIILVVIEIFTLGLTTIWFAGGALVAILVAALGGPIAMKYFNRDRERTNAESLVGRQAIVISEINNLQGIGQVTINGMEWTARSIMDDHIIEPGEVVIVRGINGVKLLVEDRKDFEKKEEQLLENNMN